MSEQPAIITRPTQAEVNYKSHADERQCQQCRWYAKASDGGPYCHLVTLTPEPIAAEGSCDRHETLTPDALMDTDKALPPAVNVDIVEPTFVDEPVTVADDGAVTIEPAPEVATETVEVSAPVADKAALERVWQRITDAIKGRKVDDASDIKVVGNHFLITWSNNFEDRDGEIFTAKAIDDYVARVDTGIVAQPELWVWHVGKASRIGQALFVARHGHFLLAAGEFDSNANAQKARDYYVRNARKTAVSHGFTYPKDKFDGKHYHQFNTFEISLLPRGKEANRYTRLEGIKEMAIAPEKLEYLKTVFEKNPEQLEGILSDLDVSGKALEAIDAAFKDFVAVDETAANVETEAAKEAVENASKDFAQLVVDLVGDNAAVLTQAAEAMKALVSYKASTDAQIKAQADAITKLQEQLDDRPRSASKDEATELTPERIAAMNDTINKQSKTLHPLWGTEVSSLD